MLIYSAALIFCGAIWGQEWHPISAPPNSILASPLSPKAPIRTAFFSEPDIVFPHLAMGGGWETVMVIVNMSNRTMNYRTLFYDQNGQPMNVTIRNYPEGQLQTGSGINSTLTAGSSFNFSLFDDGGPTRVGWAILDYDSSLGRLGGYAVFRQRVTGRSFIPEALVPLSAYDDTRFFLPVDNIQGFDTAIALVNPGSNLANQIRLTAYTLEGAEIASTTISLPPGGHAAFSLKDRLPALTNRLATLYVESGTTRLSALGLRFSPTATFSSVPIMNWSGLFQ